MKSEEYTVSLDTTTLVTLMLKSADPVAFLLSKRHWHLLVSGGDGTEFITSDQPVSLVAKKHFGPFGPAHGMPETWCLFPLDRRHALLGTFEDESVVEKCARSAHGGAIGTDRTL